MKKHPLAKPRRWRSGRVLLVAGIVAGLSAGALAPTPVSAATSSTLLYSTDGGSTWSSTATVPAGGTVLVRQWYDNTGSSNETASSVRTTVPAGFTLQGGSTQVCLNPSTSNPASPSSAELVCEDSSEGAVWSGANLQISPSAGFYGESNGSTSGQTATGRKRYLNLHQCIWRYSNATNDQMNTFTDVFTGTIWDANTNVGNTADTTASCGGGASGWSLITSGQTSRVRALDLLGNGWFNLHQCAYEASSSDNARRTYIVGAVGTTTGSETNTSNTADSSPGCGPGGATVPPIPGTTGVKAIPIASNRYLHLHQCTWTNTASGRENRTTTLIDTNAGAPAFSSGSTASNSPSSTIACGTSTAAYSPAASLTGVTTYDLLDAARGAGYVEYALSAPASPSPAACAGAFAGTEAFNQSGTYQSAQTPVATSTGNLTVDFSAQSEPCPVDPIPTVDPVVGGALAAVAGAGYLLYRRTRPQLV
jgi:hypothetical protein